MRYIPQCHITSLRVTREVLCWTRVAPWFSKLRFPISQFRDTLCKSFPTLNPRYADGNSMLLTITTTHNPATDLGFLLHKNPNRVHTSDLPFGRAHVFYPEATLERCTASLLLEVDPIGLVRGRHGSSGEGRILEQYVNDRPYAASSFLSVAISRVYHSAMAGRSKERPELAATAIPLVARIGVLPCRGGDAFLRRLFEPLGYVVDSKPFPLDDRFAEWGVSPYFDVSLKVTKKLCELLTHLYVLIPVLDNDKHYWVGDDEVEKLLHHGQGWLESHPEREGITRRYLKHRYTLVDDALSRLAEEAAPASEGEDVPERQKEAVIEEPLHLNEHRIQAVIAILLQRGAKTVVDLGCGEGKLVRALLDEKQIERITGFEVSFRTLERLSRRLKEHLVPKQLERIQLLHGSLTYRDTRLESHDAAVVMEVIEHLDADRLSAFERVLFKHAHPATVLITTPNAEYNVKFERLHAGEFRHHDHRFEWTRSQFESWANEAALRFGYAVSFTPIGPVDTALGPPTQMAVFTR